MTDALDGTRDAAAEDSAKHDIQGGDRIVSLHAGYEADGVYTDGFLARPADGRPRPVGVVTLPSRTRPQLIRSLGAHIAEVGRLPLLGSVAYRADASPITRSNSAQRLRALEGALTVPPSLATALAEARGPVFLVDDYTDTGWTLAVAARMLLRSGAERVLPLVLATRG